MFAGEDVECTITLKNIQATEPAASHDAEPKTPLRSVGAFSQLKTIRIPPQTAPSRKTSAAHRSQHEAPDKKKKEQGTISSPSVVDSEAKQKTPTLPGGGFHIADSAPDRRQSRSVSIKTLGSPQQQRRTSVRHRRSLSLQTTPDAIRSRRRPSFSGKNSFGTNSPTQHSASSTPSVSAPHSPDRRRSDVRSFISGSRPRLSSRRSSPLPLRHTSSFPLTPIRSSIEAPKSPDPAQSTLSPDTPKIIPLTPPILVGNDYPERTSSHNRILSLKSNDETPRSSADFYAQSNRSDETLASELPPSQPNGRLLRKPLHRPQLSKSRSFDPGESPVETLMMGYVQISGSFTLDESLVNQAPFEEVKRKAVVGGQAGGGVVGVATPHSGSGYFGGLSWGNIGSLGGFLGSNQPSSINEMKGIADSKSIPLLSTPKSILFVELKLAPGQSKSYNYKFRMPRGLPPTHKGRAMKVLYNVTIGTQRASKNNQQHIKQVEVPFRVFSGVNNMGESLGHDLFSPYIILKEQARISALDPSSRPPSPQLTNGDSTGTSSSSEDFQSYVDHLLTQPRKSSHFGLLSPTAETDSPSHQFQPTSTPSTRNLIDHAIRQSTLLNSAIYSPTKFEIARSSVPIATFMLSRPAVKLGDLLICVFDFTAAKVPCYALEAMLESSERIDPALAIRSAQSVERATRRVWARTAESCVWARRVTVRFQVPVAATPGFTTTGVGVDWCVRVEIIIGKTAPNSVPPTTPNPGTSSGATSTRPSLESSTRPRPGDLAAPPAAIEGGGTAASRSALLDVVNSDERGVTLAARQGLPCESFEVAIPIRVFGAVAVGGVEHGTGVDGLAV